MALSTGRRSRFGLGFAIEALFWVAVIAAIVWVVGFFVRGAERTWYRW